MRDSTFISPLHQDSQIYTSSRNFTRRVAVRHIVSSFENLLLISDLGRVSGSGMLSALCSIDCKELDFMNALLHRKSPSIGGRNPGSKRSVELSEKHSLALLCFTTANGLLSFVAAMFTTMLTLSAGWRYFWLVICRATFGPSLVGTVLFCLSYKKNKPGDVY